MNSMVEHVGKALAGQTEYQMQRKKQRKEERSKYNAKKKKEQIDLFFNSGNTIIWLLLSWIETMAIM